MKITQPAHARLQIAIREWMRKEIDEAQVLFEENEHSCGVVTGTGWVVTSDLVAMHAADAAYNSVIQSLDIVNLIRGS